MIAEIKEHYVQIKLKDGLVSILEVIVWMTVWKLQICVRMMKPVIPSVFRTFGHESLAFFLHAELLQRRMGMNWTTTKRLSVSALPTLLAPCPTAIRPQAASHDLPSMTPRVSVNHSSHTLSSTFPPYIFIGHDYEDYNRIPLFRAFG